LVQYPNVIYQQNVVLIFEQLCNYSLISVSKNLPVNDR